MNGPSTGRRELVKIGLAERERLTDPQAGLPEHDDQAAQTLLCGPLPAGRIIATISSTLGGSARYVQLCDRVSAV